MRFLTRVESGVPLHMPHGPRPIAQKPTVLRGCIRALMLPGRCHVKSSGDAGLRTLAHLEICCCPHLTVLPRAERLVSSSACTSAHRRGGAPSFSRGRKGSVPLSPGEAEGEGKAVPESLVHGSRTRQKAARETLPRTGEGQGVEACPALLVLRPSGD